jgi:hypothetical protein
MKDMTQKLPVLKKRKLIKVDEFKRVAEKVSESLKEERQYLYERKLKNEDTLSPGTYIVS